MLTILWQSNEAYILRLVTHKGNHLFSEMCFGNLNLQLIYATAESTS